MELKQAVACLQDKVTELSVVQAEKVTLAVSAPLLSPPSVPACPSVPAPCAAPSPVQLPAATACVPPWLVGRVSTLSCGLCSLIAAAVLASSSLQTSLQRWCV